ncbi:ankyrin repeat domain-containing protein [Rhodophyticola porphyridii]|uniref:Ankyrin repeat domain-containing protein n=2 Tax=Rhodophyticola porphyridii TaxID=1852017 RepID=A0A3L9XZB8_9RHOB|nr:ankyrin repeat domain-containing protein [Rhodophyticola porphyridii]
MSKEGPNIFRAAENGDLDELQAALDDGQTLQDRKATQAFMTPVHVAAWHGQQDFVVRACEIDTAPANMQDGYGNFPIEYAMQRRDENALVALRDVMTWLDQPFEDADFNF